MARSRWVMLWDLMMEPNWGWSGRVWELINEITVRNHDTFHTWLDKYQQSYCFNILEEGQDTVIVWTNMHQINLLFVWSRWVMLWDLMMEPNWGWSGRVWELINEITVRNHDTFHTWLDKYQQSYCFNILEEGQDTVIVWTNMHQINLLFVW